MQVMCIKGHKDLLEEGSIYNVTMVTQNGNFLLDGVEVPEGFTSFSKDRFSLLDDGDVWADVDFDEEAFWAEQPTEEYTA